MWCVKGNPWHTVALVLFSAIVILSSVSLHIAGCGWVEVGGCVGGSTACWAEPDLSTPPSAGVSQQSSMSAGGVWGIIHSPLCLDSACGQVQEHKFRPIRKALLATAAPPGFYCLFSVFLIHKWAKTLSKCSRSKSDQQSSCGVSLLRKLDWKHREWPDMHVLIQSGWKMCPCVLLI